MTNSDQKPESSDNDQVSKKSIGDHVHATVRGSLGAIPFAGAAAAELFDAVVMPPLEVRRNMWRELVGQRLRDLEEKHRVNAESLRDDEAFITVVMQASQAAMRNHANEKLEALRNAIVNTALKQETDEAMQQMFINYVDTFTVWHIRLLKLFQDPAGWFQATGKHAPPFVITGSVAQMIQAAYPEIGNRRDLLETIVNDLNTKGLGGPGGALYTIMSGRGPYEKRTTDLGDQFLSFISER